MSDYNEFLKTVKIRIAEIVEREKHLENLAPSPNSSKACIHFGGAFVASEILDFITSLENEF